MPFTLFDQNSSSLQLLILRPSQYRVRDEAPNLNAEDVILRCLVRATAHLGVGMNMEQQRRNLLQ
jgi:hypothetical protein